MAYDLTNVNIIFQIHLTQHKAHRKGKSAGALAIPVAAGEKQAAIVEVRRVICITAHIRT